MWILNIILLIFILGILIFIHELGHFLAAKSSGVYIYEFALGMGPVIYSKKGKDGVLYQIRLFPIGGFVQMAGEVLEDDKTNTIPKEKFMCNRPWYQRLLILVAGVVMNFLLALFILFGMSLIWGHSSLTPIVGDVVLNYAMDEAGIVSGDKIVKINKYKVNTWDKAQIVLALKHEGPYMISVEHKDGTVATYEVTPHNNIYGFEIDDEQFLQDNGNIIPVVKNVISSYPADVAGLLKGDIIISVSSKDVSTWTEVKDAMDACEENCVIEVKRNDEVLELELVARDKVFGFSIENKIEKGFFSSIKYAFVKMGSVISSMCLTIGNLFTGKLALSALSGPVGIYTVVGQSAKAGIEQIIYLVAFLSINLGFINILPFPAFDGGRILFLIIEKIKGSPVKPEVESWFHLIGFILLILLMVYITFQDILRLF